MQSFSGRFLAMRHVLENGSGRERPVDRDTPGRCARGETVFMGVARCKLGASLMDEGIRGNCRVQNVD